MKKQEFDQELQRLLDRREDVRACCGRVADTWRYDLKTRKSGTAYQDEDGVFRTNLDLAAYLAALVERQAVVTFPEEYKARRAATKTEGQVLTSKSGRHGRLKELKSNAETWGFSGTFNDANVITTDSVGEDRTFFFQDLTGEWYDGWKVLQLMPKSEEEKRLFEGTAGTVTFDHFIHPNRWTSVYSRAYLLAKIAIARLADQQRWLKTERARLQKALNVEARVWPKKETVGAAKKIEVWACEFAVDGIDFRGEYTPYATTPEALEEVGFLLHRVDQLIKQLRFNARASEYAFWRHGILEAVPETELLDWLAGSDPTPLPAPAWAADATWKTGHKLTAKASTYWAVLEREGGLTLRWRAWRKTERVAA